MQLRLSPPELVYTWSIGRSACALHKKCGVPPCPDLSKVCRSHYQGTAVYAGTYRRCCGVGEGEFLLSSLPASSARCCPERRRLQTLSGLLRPNKKVCYYMTSSPEIWQQQATNICYGRWRVNDLELV